jgi:hypothetical protein
MTDHSLARATADELLDAIVDRIAARLAARMSQPSTTAEFYDSSSPPPGVSWRRVLDLARRGAVPLTRVGRNARVSRDAWGAYVSGRERPAAVRDADAELADALGLRLVAGGR